MGRRIFLTYKRRRLLSRSDNSGLHSDALHVFSNSKISSNFCNHEESRADLPNNSAEIGAAHDSSKIKVGEYVSRCDSRSSPDPVECSEDSEKGRLDPSCPKLQRNEEESGAPLLENGSSDVAKLVVCKDAHFEGGLGEKSQIHYSGTFVCEEKSADDVLELLPTLNVSSECDYEVVKTLSASPSLGAGSGDDSNVICMKTSDDINCNHNNKDLSILARSDSGNFPSKCCEDDFACFCNCNSTITKPRFSSSLITFCRRTKRKLDGTAPVSAYEVAYNSWKSPKPAAAVDCKNLKLTDSTISLLNIDGKDKLEHPDGSSFRAPESTIARVTQQDNALHLAHGLVEDTPKSLDPHSDREASPLQGKACIDIKALDMRCQSVLLEDPSTSRIASDDYTKLHNSSPFHEFITLPACRDIDCNRPLEADSDGKHLPISLEAPHYPSGSIDSKRNVNGSILQLQLPESSSVLRDKGKRPVDSCRSSSRCKSLELFPESISAEKPQLTNEATISAPKERWFSSQSASLQLPFLNSFPFGNDASSSSPSFCGWLDGFPPSTSSREQYPLPRESMFFSSNGAKSATVNRSSSLDRLSSQSLWLDEELDSLWIGVRRHGRRNFESILRDPRLHFLPWRTPCDLADRWQEEQQKLIHKTYPCPQELSKANLNTLLLDQLSMAIQRSRQLQKPVTNLSSLWNSSRYTSRFDGIQCNESKRSLPHWLREASEPKGLTVAQSPAHGIPHYARWLSNQGNYGTAPSYRYNAIHSHSNVVRGALGNQQRKSEPDECIVAKQDDMVIVRSDASSEETISDDRNIG